MKKKGFTLIELIVVIAIIGVLCAILIPAMLGYVKKSKITTANTTAKSIYNAFNNALTEMDTQDKNYSGGNVSTVGASFYTNNTATNLTGTSLLAKKVSIYFDDIKKVGNFQVNITNGAAIGCAVLSGQYPGTYPKQMTVDEYDAKNSWTMADAISFAMS